MNMLRKFALWTTPRAPAGEFLKWSKQVPVALSAVCFGGLVNVCRLENRCYIKTARTLSLCMLGCLMGNMLHKTTSIPMITSVSKKIVLSIKQATFCINTILHINSFVTCLMGILSCTHGIDGNNYYKMLLETLARQKPCRVLQMMPPAQTFMGSVTETGVTITQTGPRGSAFCSHKGHLRFHPRSAKTLRPG